MSHWSNEAIKTKFSGASAHLAGCLCNPPANFATTRQSAKLAPNILKFGFCNTRVHRLQPLKYPNVIIYGFSRSETRFSLHTLLQQYGSSHRAAQGLHILVQCHHHLCPWHRGNDRDGGVIEAFCAPETEAAGQSVCKSTHGDCSNLNWPLSSWEAEE